MAVSIMRARSVDEAHLYMDLRGVARDGRTHRLVDVSGVLVAMYEGVHGGELERFAFDIPEPMGTDGRFGGPTPSEIITPAQFMKTADAITRGIPADASRLSEAARKAAAAELDHAADCVHEVLKFIPPGRDAVPLNRFLSAEDIKFLYVEQGRFQRVRLEAVRAAYRAQASAMRAPPPAPSASKAAPPSPQAAPDEPPVLPPTSDALRALQEAMLAAARAGDTKRLEALARSCAVADPDAFFRRFFGPHLAARLALEHADRRASLPIANLVTLYRHLATLEGDLTFETLVTDPTSDVSEDAAGIWEHAAEPAPLGAVVVARRGERPMLVLRDWMHDGRWFRYVGPLFAMLAQRPEPAGLRELALHLGWADTFLRGEAEFQAARMVLPQPEAWFVERFGRERGQAMAAVYARGVEAGEVHQRVAALLADAQDSPGELRVVRGRSARLSREVDALRRGVADAMLRHAPLYAIDAAHRGHESFAYVEERWRWVGSVAMYAELLPASPHGSKEASEYPDGEDGLCALVRDLTRAAVAAPMRLPPGSVPLLESLAMPNRAAWLLETFGPEVAAWLAERYRPDATPIAHALRMLAEGSDVDVRATGVDRPDAVTATSNQAALLLLARRPLTLWTVRVKHPDAGQPLVIGSFVYHAGAWRFLSKVEALDQHPIMDTVLRQSLRYPAPTGESGPFGDGQAEGLAALFRAIYAALADGDDGKAEHLARSLVLPNPEGWLPRLLTPDLAASMIAPYVAGARGGWQQVLRDAWNTKPPPRDFLVHQLAGARPGAPPAYAIEFVFEPLGPGRPRTYGMGLWPLVFVEGAWRALRWELSLTASLFGQS
jgi:hypothetical protein